MKTNNNMEQDLAVFTEFGKDIVEMQGGWNVRVFNETEFTRGSGITLSDDGTINLAPGIYHISALSLLAYGVNREQKDEDTASEDLISAGYCGIFAGNKLLATGSMMDYQDNTPSLIDTLLEFTNPTDIHLKHQVGPEKPKDVFLQWFGDNQSTNHVLARITIHRL